MYKLVELVYYVVNYYNNYVYTVESVASTIADKEGGIEPPSLSLLEYILIELLLLLLYS